MNSSVLLISLLAILIGFYFKQFWLSIIFIIALVLVLGLEGKPKARGTPSGGPKVQPIIVKRKYVGPESIYPEKMKIEYNPRGYNWKSKTEAFGKAIGSGFRWFKNLFE